MKFTLESASKIKMVIWDLDDTFWQGTLADYDAVIIPIQMNIDLVKKTTNRGIINSICSKNDKDIAESKLESIGIKDFFVFNSINWDSKGNRIKNSITSMALRPANVLFLDDNLSNLAEAEYVMPELMVSTPDIIPELYSIVEQLGKDDENHSRLYQYKLLEKKRDDEVNFSSNQDFLCQSNITIQFGKLDDSIIPRIVELIQRSNQLNFTKKRIGEDDLRRLLLDENIEMGYVSVADNYGKYGIVGFFALNSVEHKLDHFLFSCRTMGMGIEQYVYASLGYPMLDIVEPVSGSVSKEAGMPQYITRVDRIEVDAKAPEGAEKGLHVLLKGPCDLEVMASYLESGQVNLGKEFNFVDHMGNQADYFNHLINILNDDGKRIDEWCEKYSFLTKEGFETKLFSGEYDVICLSPLMDATLAVYADKQGNRLAYGLCAKPLCNSENHSSYRNKEIMTARSDFSESELVQFSDEFEQIPYSADMIADNMEIVIDRILKKNENTKVVLLLLGELEYKSHKPVYIETFGGKHLFHRDINEQLRSRFTNSNSVYLLDVNKYIKSQQDYFDNINHYSKYVYYEMAQEFVEYIESISKVHITTSSKVKMLFQNFKRKIYKLLFVK